MERIDLIKFNKEFLQRLKSAGINIDDYKHCDLYDEYLKLKATARSRKEIILTLSQKFHISDRQVYNIIKHLETKV